MRIRILVSTVRIVIAVLLCGFTAASVLAEEVVEVGAIQALTGPVAPAAEQLNAGLTDSLTIANGQGGINGKTIRYVMKDGHYDLALATAAFESIMSKHKPLVLFGESTAFCRNLAEQIRKNRYRIVVASPSFTSSLADQAMFPSVFVPGPTFGDQFGILLKYIARQNLDKKPYRATVAFVYTDTGFGKDPIKYGRVMCERLRLKLVTEEVLKMGSGEVAEQIGRLAREDPEYVILHGFIGGPTVVSVIKQCRNLGMKCKFMGTNYCTTKMLLDQLGPMAKDYYGVNPYSYWWMDQVPMIRKIRDYTAKQYPDVEYRPIHYMEGFLCGMIFVDILRKADTAGQLNYEGLVKALHALKDFDTGGLTAPLTNINNRFPVARIWKANPDKGIFDPESDWINLFKR